MFGKVKGVVFFQDPKRKPNENSSASIEFATIEDMNKAIEGMNGGQIDGSVVTLAIMTREQLKTQEEKLNEVISKRDAEKERRTAEYRRSSDYRDGRRYSDYRDRRHRRGRSRSPRAYTRRR